jgi:hypothetical protein
MGTTSINGLNDKGQFVGFYVDGDDTTHGLLVTVPDPVSMTLFGIGVTAALSYARRRRTKKADAR